MIDRHKIKIKFPIKLNKITGYMVKINIICQTYLEFEEIK